VSLITGGAGETPVALEQRTTNVTDEVGYQVARVAIEAHGYSPRNTIVYAGTPVKWMLAADGFGCQSIIDATSLGITDYIEATTDTEVEFTPIKPGTYPFQCAMGMYKGTFTVIDPP